MSDPSALRVLVTGAGGNLGRKLVAHLAQAPWCAAVTALDVAPPPAPHAKVRPVALDLRRRSADLDGAMAGADAAVHLAAQRPYPDATWADAAASVDMTLNVVEALARAGGARRLVFASSNHVMGGYKDRGVAPGALTTALPPLPGTRTGAGEPERAYAAAKLMGERVLAARAAAGDLTAVSLRIGWCQPGPNRPGTMTATGIPGDPGAADTPDARRTLAWFRGMWLSNRDLVAVLEAALRADASAWPTPAILVNAMSDNAGMAWDLAATRALIGFRPRDDAAREAAA